MTFFDWAKIYIDRMEPKDMAHWLEDSWKTSATVERERLAKMLKAEGWFAAAVLVRNK